MCLTFKPTSKNAIHEEEIRAMLERSRRAKQARRREALDREIRKLEQKRKDTGLAYDVPDLPILRSYTTYGISLGDEELPVSFVGGILEHGERERLDRSHCPKREKFRRIPAIYA